MRYNTYNGDDIVKVKTDVIFKKFFTDENNGELLKDFVANLLRIPKETIEQITILNPEMSPEEVDGKFVRLDLRILLNDKKIVCIEIQLYAHPGFKDRIVYYACKNFGNQLKEGQNYDELKETISIVLTDFKLFDTSDYHSVFELTDRTHDIVLTDKFQIHFCEMPKLGKEIDENDMLQVWLKLLSATKKEDLEMLANVRSPEIQKSVRIIYDYSSDARTRELARIREDALHLEATIMAGAKREGSPRCPQRRQARRLRRACDSCIKIIYSMNRVAYFPHIVPNISLSSFSRVVGITSPGISSGGRVKPPIAVRLRYRTFFPTRAHIRRT